jgi:hypothetical protein
MMTSPAGPTSAEGTRAGVILPRAGIIWLAPPAVIIGGVAV